MIIDIPDDQVYTIEKLATDLAFHKKWKDVKVNKNSEVLWDISYLDTDGYWYFMCLDGCVYNNEECTDEDGNYIDYRDDLGICELAWVIVPESVDPHRVIGIIS